MSDEDHKMRIQLAVDTLLARAADARRAGLEVEVGPMYGPFTPSIMEQGGRYKMDFKVKRVKTI